MPDTPEQIKEHSNKYKYKSWEEYTLAELGNWIHNLVKRAGHRSENEAGSEKAEKDLEDAENYLEMMRSKIKDHKEKILN